jgi:hypothetical protein
MASKNCTAGRPCCNSHSSEDGDSSNAGVMPAATVRKTFWLCSILLARSRATTSTSSVCWVTTRRMASWPDARATSHADTVPDNPTASAATAIRRQTSAPGMNQPGASLCGSDGGAGGFMGTPSGNSGECHGNRGRWRGTSGRASVPTNIRSPRAPPLGWNPHSITRKNPDKGGLERRQNEAAPQRGPPPPAPGARSRISSPPWTAGRAAGAG